MLSVMDSEAVGGASLETSSSAGVVSAFVVVDVDDDDPGCLSSNPPNILHQL